MSPQHRRRPSSHAGAAMASQDEELGDVERVGVGANGRAPRGQR